MKRIAIIAALRGELRPLVKGWQQRGPLYTGRIGEAECVAVCAGIGRDAAARALGLALAEGAPGALISIGWAGALSCGVKPGQAHPVAEVIDARTGERYSTDFAAPGKIRLVTIDHVAAATEKRSLAERYLAAMVDMEAATVGRLARARDIPFYCFKGISDGANEKLPDFNRFINRSGQLRLPPFALHAAVHPLYWPALVRLGGNSKQAAEALTALVRGFIEQTIWK